MIGQDDIGRGQERMIRRRGFRIKHIEAGPGQVPRSERRRERNRIDQPAAGRVDEERPALHRSKGLCAKNTGRCWRQSQVQRYGIGLRQQLAEGYRGNLNAKTLGGGFKGFVYPCLIEVRTPQQHAGGAEAKHRAREGFPGAAKPGYAYGRSMY